MGSNPGGNGEHSLNFQQWLYNWLAPLEYFALGIAGAVYQYAVLKPRQMDSHLEQVQDCVFLCKTPIGIS